MGDTCPRFGTAQKCGDVIFGTNCSKMWGVGVSVVCGDMGGQCKLQLFTREKCEGVILDSNCSKVWGVGMSALCEYGWEVQFEVLYQGEVRRCDFGFKL